MPNLTKFTPSDFESKLQKIWEEKGVYQPDLKRAKKPLDRARGKPFYNLMMFPYPSAEGLHVGNMYAFTGADIYGRFKRMQGNDVFEPIGLDGFGIHSENYAIKIGKHPAEQAKISEKNFYRQLHAIGNGFAWKNTLETYDPDYYRWTQWIFVQMFKHGLAYRKKSAVNFCPSCKTVLADEQVIDGVCERCKTLVEKRDMEQWFFKITAYAEKLLQNTYKKSFNWSNKVKIAQQNWIGKSEGVTLRFKVKDMDIHFEMFDSVPQTFMAQTFTVIAPEYPKLYELVKDTEYEKSAMEFVERIKKKKTAKKFDVEKEIDGVFTGRYIEYTPAKRLLPIWVASFVIAEYGSGVVNASAHDERDFAFAKKYNLPLHPVMFPEDPREAEKVKKLVYCYHHAPDGILTEPQEFKGRKWGEVRDDVITYIERHGWGKRTSQYHLRDWLISRQRYWGPPIPMIYCPKCHWQPVSEKDLPVLLPDVSDWRPKGEGKSPLANILGFVNTTCPKCSGPAQRETDVSDTFLDSAWYFLRYPSVGHLSNLSDLPWNPEITKKWLPVHMYIGGAEHSVLHLLYSRFLIMALHDFGYLHFEEPFSRFYAHGLIIAEGAKMSKSKGNIVIPDEYIRKYGSDALRTYLMFLGPFDQGGDFRDTGIAGMYRFLGRVWRLVNEVLSSKSLKLPKSLKPQDTSGVAAPSEGEEHDSPEVERSEKLLRIMHKTIKEVTEDLENLRYNTAIAHIMEFVNELQKLEIASRAPDSKLETIKVLLLLLAPFAPHMTEELWQRLSGQWSVVSGQNRKDLSKKPTSNFRLPTSDFRSIHLHPWPSFDPKYLQEEKVTIVVQVNGKLRDIIKVKSQKSKVKSLVEEGAKKSEKIQKYLEGKQIKKVIFVPGRLVNFVT